MKKVIKKIGVTFVILCILSFTALLCALLYTKRHELIVNKQDEDLIDLYREDLDQNEELHIVDGTEYSYGNVDCILHLDTIGVTLPVLRGNTSQNLAMFRTVLANNRMQLGVTNYSIMSHHARDMSISLSGISRLRVGDTVQIEKDSIFYEYSVVNNYVEYAEKCDELFNPKAGTSVFLFTCDYTLPGKEVAYRIVKCELKDSSVFDNEKSSVIIKGTEE